MRPRRAVLQILPKSSVPRRLPFYNSCHPLTPSESTLLQVLIPLDFISSRINTYTKQGGGSPSAGIKVLQLVNPTPKFVITPSPKFVIPSAARNLLFPPFPSLCLCLITSLRRYFAFPRFFAHTPTSATPVPSMLYFTVLCIPIIFICPAPLVTGRRLSLAGACLRSSGPRDLAISRRTWRSHTHPGSAWLRAG